MNETHRSASFEDHAPSAGVTSAEVASRLLRRLFRHLDESLSLRLWNGESLRVGRANERHEPKFTLVFRNPQVVRALVLSRDPLAIADAYFRGDIDVEGDFRAALGLRHQLHRIRLGWGERIAALLAALRLPARARDAVANGAGSARRAADIKRHSRAENRDAIRFHYDVSNDFYALWLDPQLIYSCAYFESAQADLETAQRAKLEHICRKLMLRPGERLLDIGCGWGALLMHAARHHGVRAHGVTLSARQHEFAQRRIQDAGLTDSISVELRDYRDLEGHSRFDKIVSVGMFEHVGIANLPRYFECVQRLLEPGGLFLNHGITHEAHAADGAVSTRFINRYVFPDGQLDTISHVQSVMEDARFEILDVEGWRRHYALTLAEWVRRLEGARDAALRHVNEATYRVWRLYMSACALEFDAGGLGVYQILAARRGSASNSLPLTRRHLYAGAQTRRARSDTLAPS